MIVRLLSVYPRMRMRLLAWRFASVGRRASLGANVRNRRPDKGLSGRSKYHS
ncbi:MAG: hypothetical protein KatS3mg111_3072 [Pirellulaceae bacterium]|nr:MAG: hypothetical protein KatS3mg111_3072 [Pirellulaceae bacterium]